MLEQAEQISTLASDLQTALEDGDTIEAREILTKMENRIEGIRESLDEEEEPHDISEDA